MTIHTVVATAVLTFLEFKHGVPEGAWNLCGQMYLRGSKIKNSVRLLFIFLKVTEAQEPYYLCRIRASVEFKKMYNGGGMRHTVDVQM